MFAKSIFALLLFVVAISQANAALTIDQIKRISDISKLYGVCSTYQKISLFQVKNPTLAESKFLGQFMAAEAERYGLPSAIALWEKCEAEKEVYDQIYIRLGGQ